MKVGLVVKLKLPCLDNPPGTFGICYYDYGDGCQFIFENGSYDGFSDEEQKDFLVVMGANLRLSNYHFKNVIRLSEDFRNGVFDFDFIKKNI